jgi:hypothetical protein
LYGVLNYKKHLYRTCIRIENGIDNTNVRYLLERGNCKGDVTIQDKIMFSLFFSISIVGGGKRGEVCRGSNLFISACVC